MKLVKFVVSYGTKQEGVTDLYTFAASDGRQVIGTYNEENVVDEDIVDEMVVAGFKVTVIA